MNRNFLVVLCLLLSVPAQASDFTPLMLMMLVPYAIVGSLVVAITWLGTRAARNIWVKAVVRAAGLAIVFTPTYTDGGSGQMVSVALYDLFLSAMGDDPVYGQQALVNAGIASVVLSVVLACVYRSKSDR